MLQQGDREMEDHRHLPEDLLRRSEADGGAVLIPPKSGQASIEPRSVPPEERRQLSRPQGIDLCQETFRLLHVAELQ
ncbi:MAG TPA: hypothetical protein DIT48_13475 [Actinobacteria bacterium]|nr:hypothetical protein [Actinomycetota bacterium]